MGLLDLFRRSEARGTNGAAVTQSRSDFWQAMGLDMGSGPQAVTIESALRVPAVSCAVNFIAETIASLPLDYYRRDRRTGARTDGSGPIVSLIKDAANDHLTAFEWRKSLIVAKLTDGRGLSYIERDLAGRPVNLWPLDPCKVTIRRDGFVQFYQYNDGREQNYAADEVIDLTFMLKADGLSHRGPISMGRNAIGLALAATEYGAKFFAGGGVPPFAITGNFQTPGAMQRAANDLAAAVKKAKSENRLALALPDGIKLEKLGANPDDSQLVELQRFCIEEIARIYSIPPTFLQDLTHGTYSNTEQQDLHFVKHTLLHHVKQFEQELNLKLFGRGNRNHYVEFNIDGIMRGDFKSRMEGWARGIQTGIVTPNEVRRAENYPDMDGGDRLYVQGATVPLAQAGNGNPSPTDPTSSGASSAGGTQA